MGIDVEILAYEETSLGPLCLRRRLTLSEPRQSVTEVTLNHEFLMSSLHTESERALATEPLKRIDGERLRVLVGGLGLGYTAQAAMLCERVEFVEVVEFLPPVIDWLRNGLIPLADELNAHPKLTITQGDIFQRLLMSPTSQRFDAILIDVDHSPDDQLAEVNHHFYEVDGLQSAVRHLNEKGQLALWSYDQHTPLLEAMRQVFDDATVLPIRFYNQLVHEHHTDWLYMGRRRSR